MGSRGREPLLISLVNISPFLWNRGNTGRGVWLQEEGLCETVSISAWDAGENCPSSLGFPMAEWTWQYCCWSDKAFEKHMPARVWFFYSYVVEMKPYLNRQLCNVYSLWNGSWPSLRSSKDTIMSWEQNFADTEVSCWLCIQGTVFLFDYLLWMFLPGWLGQFWENHSTAIK